MVFTEEWDDGSSLSGFSYVIRLLSLISYTSGIQSFLMRTVEHVAFIIMLMIEIAKTY